MGSKYPVLKDTEIVRRLKKLGYTFKSQKGSHAKYVKITGTHKNTVIVPMNKDTPRGTLQSILEQANLSLEQFMQ